MVRYLCPVILIPQPFYNYSCLSNTKDAEESLVILYIFSAVNAKPVNNRSYITNKNDDLSTLRLVLKKRSVQHLDIRTLGLFEFFSFRLINNIESR